MRRRTVLATGTGVLAALAGCVGSSDGGPTTATDTRTPTEGPEPTASPTPTDEPTPTEGPEPTATATRTTAGKFGLRLRYAYYPDQERLYVHHNGGSWLYNDAGDRLVVAADGETWSVFGPDSPFAAFAVGENQPVDGVPPDADLELVAAPGGGAERTVGEFRTPSERDPLVRPPDRFPVYDPFGYAPDGDALTVTNEEGPEFAADRLAVHVAGGRSAWEDADGTVAAGDRTTVSLRESDRIVKVTWRGDDGWRHGVGNHVLDR